MSADEVPEEDESETRQDCAGPDVVQDGPSSPEAVDLRTVEPQTARSTKDASSSDDERRSRTKRRAAVSFGEVEIFTHAPALDGSKVPRDGRAPMGLGIPSPSTFGEWTRMTTNDSCRGGCAA